MKRHKNLLSILFSFSAFCVCFYVKLNFSHTRRTRGHFLIKTDATFHLVNEKLVAQLFPSKYEHVSLMWKMFFLFRVHLVRNWSFIINLFFLCWRMEGRRREKLIEKRKYLSNFCSNSRLNEANAAQFVAKEFNFPWRIQFNPQDVSSN